MDWEMPWSTALAEGQRRLDRADPLGAIPFLLRAASPEAPHNEQTDAHLALGRLRVAFGQEFLALAHFRHVLALRPHQTEVRLLLGRSLLKLGWPDLTLRVFDGQPLPNVGAWRYLARKAGKDLADARLKARQSLATLRRPEAALPGMEEALIRALLHAGRLSPAERLLAVLPSTPERRWLAALALLRRRQGVAHDALRRALRPSRDAPPGLRQEAAQRLLELGEVAAAIRAVGTPSADRHGREMRARLLLLENRLPELMAISEADFARRPEQTDTARWLLTAQVLTGTLPVWTAPDPGASANTPLALVQFWHDPQLPDEVRTLMDSWVHHNPGLTVARFDTDSARAFILAHDGDELVQAYDSCNDALLRSYMLRIVYLARHGGLWVDADERCLGPMDAVLARLSGVGLIATFSDELPYSPRGFVLAAPAASAVAAALLVELKSQARRALKSAPGPNRWGSCGPGLILQVAVRLPGQVELLLRTAWRSFAAKAKDLALQRETRSDG